MTLTPRPATCGECVQFLDPPRVDRNWGVAYNCKAHKLARRRTQKACGSVHAEAREQDDGQTQADWGAQ